jgi:hypothetical protein
MSKADEFRQYAEEAMRWARKCTTEREKLTLVNLARTWTQAAERSESPVLVRKLPQEHRATA